jgi:hypothetical protein
MAVVLQEVTGSLYDTRFYPSFSGVARSINFYPIAPEKPEDGVVSIAVGLGKHIVDGGVTLKFSPKYPKKVLQLSSPEMAMRETQKTFFSLDLNPDSYKPSIDDCVNLVNQDIAIAEKDGALRLIASTYDFQNNMLREGTQWQGKKVITFSNILKNNAFPLAVILQNVLEIGSKEMNNPIEIEFAVNLNPPAGSPKVFSLLQIRPIVNLNEGLQEDLSKIPDQKCLLTTQSALGNGIISDIYDFVYVKPDTFNAANNMEVVNRIDKLNSEFLKQSKNYVLVGPGRWGSSDPWLGIPVKWPQISAARVIVESGLENYRIDPSQGTHFFQNLTSFQVGYFTINPYIRDGYYDLEFLKTLPSVYEDEFLRHVHFQLPIIIKIDGKKSRGVILKPEE